MEMHVYFVISTYRPIIFQSNMVEATLDSGSSSLLVKIFSRSLMPEEDANATPSHSGDQGIATLIVADKVVYLKNQSIPNLERLYPQLGKIKELAQNFVNEFNRDICRMPSTCEFAKKIQQLEDVIIHGISNSQSCDR